MFDGIDTNGSGQISTQELGNMLEELGQILNEQQVEEFFALIDKDGSGSINFEEFYSHVSQ